MMVVVGESVNVERERERDREMRGSGKAGSVSERLGTDGVF